MIMYHVDKKEEKPRNDVDDVIMKLRRLSPDKMNYLKKIVDKMLFEQAAESNKQTRLK